MSSARQFLREFHNALPDGPLPPGDSRYWPIYENRQLTRWDPVDPLARNIDFAAQPHLQFLAGSAGCGKSTELLRLRHRLEEDGHRVFLLDLALPVDDLTGKPGIPILPSRSGASPWLLFEILRVLDQDSEQNLLGPLSSLLRELPNSPPRWKSGEPLEDPLREVSRWWARVFDNHAGDLTPELAEIVRRILEELHAQDSRKVVLLVDSLPRLLQQGNILLRSDLDLLKSLGFFIVLVVDPYTGTNSMLHSRLHAKPEWLEPLEIQGSDFGSVFKAWQTYLASLGDWHSLVDEEGLRSIFRTSGGSLGIVFGLLRQITIRAGDLPLPSGALAQILADAREELASLDDDEEREILIEVARGGELSELVWSGMEKDEDRLREVRRLLRSGAILYRRDSGCYVHPLLQPSVEKILGNAPLSVGSPRTPDEHQTQDSVHLRRLEITQLRVFEDLRIDLPTPDQDQEGQWLLLLGDNGVGKTTVLRALVLALSQRPTGDTLLQLLGPSAPFLRHGAEEGRIEVQLDGGVYLARLTQDRRGVEHLSSNGRPELGFPLYAYGCQRGTALGGPDRDVDFNPLDEVRTLFDPSAHLIHAESWLTRLQLAARESTGGIDEAFFDSVLKTLTGSLHGVERIEVNKNGVWLFGPSVERAPLSALSDGYISTTGWILDLIARWTHRHRQLGAVPDEDFHQQMNGLVLIDEIDLHLHPLWQVDVVGDLRTLFPRMSFVATTHNPLTLLGAKPGEITVLRRQEQGPVQAFPRDLEPGTRADQVLTGEWFGLPSTVDRETLEKIDEHRQLVRQGIPREDPRRRTLEKELRHRLGSFQDTSIDRMVQSIAAELMPESSRQLSAEERKNLRREILKKAKDQRAHGRPGAS